MSVWQGLGINVIIFLAGLQAIPQEYYDAASVDGAARWSRFRHVTLPLLTPSMFFTGILSLIGSFQVFDQVYILARPGKPTEATITLVYFIYESGFKFFRMGEAAAASWILFLIVAVLTRHLLPLAAALGALPVTTPGSQAAAVTLAPNAASAGAARPADGHPPQPPDGALRPAHRRRPADDGPLLLDADHVAQDARRGVRGAAARASRPGAHWENYATMWNALPGRDVRDVLPQLAQARAAQHGGPARDLLDGRLRVRGDPVPRPRPAVRAPARHADHPDPGRARPELRPVAQPAQPVQRERQLLRHPGAAVGRRVAGRRVRDVPAAPVLPGRPRRSSPTRHASTARTRGRSSAGSTCRSPGRRSRRSRSSPSCGPGTTCSTR